MEAFVEQQLEIFTNRNIENIQAVVVGKPVLEVDRPDVRVIQGVYYWISGQADVYLLNTNNYLAHKMGKQEIEDLPVEIIFGGVEMTNFLVDEKRALEIILLILLKFNSMQTSQIFSFPLGL